MYGLKGIGAGMGSWTQIQKTQIMGTFIVLEGNESSGAMRIRMFSPRGPSRYITGAASTEAAIIGRDYRMLCMGLRAYQQIGDEEMTAAEQKAALTREIETP
jgi:hypothetical protein